MRIDVIKSRDEFKHMRYKGRSESANVEVIYRYMHDVSTVFKCHSFKEQNLDLIECCPTKGFDFS